MLRHKFCLLSLALMAVVGQSPPASGQSGIVAKGMAEDAVLDTVRAERETGKVSAFDLVARYKKEIEQNPKNPEPYVKAAAVYERKESEQLFKQALVISPGYLPAQLGLARYYAANRPAAALAEYQKAIALSPKDSALREEAVRAAARFAPLEELRKIVGDSVEARILLSSSLVNSRKVEEAEKELNSIPPAPALEGQVLQVKSRLLMLKANQEKDRDKGRKMWGEAVEMMLEGWRKSPAQRDLYPTYLRSGSLPELLAGQKRYREATEVIEKGVALYPKDYYLYERLWQSWFAEPKSDYSAERQKVRERAEALLKANPPSPELLRTIRNGFKLVGDLASEEQAKQQLLMAYPYSTVAREARFAEYAKAEPSQEKARLWALFNRDFPSFYPLQYQEYFQLLDKTNAPNEELRKAAQAAVDDIRDRGYGNMFLALKDIADVFLRRNIYLDDLQAWVDRAQPNPEEVLRRDKIEMPDTMILTTRARLLAARGSAVEAEATLRRLMDISAKNNRAVNADLEYALAEVLSAKGKKEEALDLYARAANDSGGFLADAEKKYRALYKELKGGEAGADEYLARLKGDSTPALAKKVELNQPAPDFDLVRVGGGRVQMSQLRGKVVFVNFWATWCGPCLKELPHLQAYYEKNKSSKEVAVVTINIDEDRAVVEPFFKARKYTLPVGLDDGTSAKMGVPPVPATIVIDAAGNMRLRILGFSEGEDLGGTLDALVAKYRTAPADSAVK